MTTYAWKNGLTPQEFVPIVSALVAARELDQPYVEPCVLLAAQCGIPAATGGCAIPFALRIRLEEAL
jgi:hypothetical protein